jgi:cephalosporin hydroxylase
VSDPNTFVAQRRRDALAQSEDIALRGLANAFMRLSLPYKYTYNFTWLGRPVIQFPQDLMALQEIIWKVRPAAVVETGVAHGGSLVFSASMLQLLGGDGIVVGVDIDIRAHNRAAIESHPLAPRIRLVEGSSTSAEVLEQVKGLIDGRGPVLVILDSNHTHDHVRQELDLYAPLVKKGSYLVVMDTAIEDAPADLFPDRPWGKGNSPKTAVHEFLRTTDRFRIDKDMEAKLLITVAPDGYLECVKD